MSEFETFDRFDAAETQPRGCLVEALLVVVLLTTCLAVGGVVAYQQFAAGAFDADPPQQVAVGPRARPARENPKQPADRAIEAAPEGETPVSDETMSGPVEDDVPEPPIESAISSDKPVGDAEETSAAMSAPMDVEDVSPDPSDEIEAVLPPVAAIPVKEVEEIEPVLPPRLPDREACDRLGAAIERSLARQEPAFLEARLDQHRLADRILAGFEVTPQVRQQVIDALRADSYAVALCNEVHDPDCIRFLRTRDVDDQRRLTFRMIAADGDANYHEFLAIELPGEGIRLIDVFNWHFGDWISQNWRRRMYPQLLTAGRRVARLPNDPADMRQARLLVQVMQDCVSRDVAQPMEKYRQLSAEMRQTVPVRMMRIVLAERTSPDEFSRAYDDLEFNLPDDPTSLLWRVRRYPYGTDVNHLLSLIERLEESLGADSFLTSRKGDVFYQAEQYERASEFYRQAQREEPRLTRNYHGLIRCAMYLERYDEVARVLTELEENAEKLQYDLTTSPEFEGFVRSEAYARWLSERSPEEPARSRSLSEQQRPTLEQCQAFGEELVRHLNRGDASFLRESIDWSQLLGRVLQIDSIEPDRFAEFMRRFPNFDDTAQRIVDALGTGGRATLLRVSEREGWPSLTVRMIPVSGAMTYLEFLTYVDDQQQVRGFDVFKVDREEYGSEDIRRRMLCNAPQFGQFGLRCQPSELEIVRAAPLLNRLFEHQAKSEIAEIWIVGKQLPDSLRYLPGIAVALTYPAWASGEEEGLAYVHAIRNRCPDHPGLALLYLHVELLTPKNAASAEVDDQLFELVDQVDQAVGGDPYLDFFRALIYAKKGDSQQAIEKFEAAIREEPRAAPAYSQWARWRLRELDLAGAKKVVDRARQAKAEMDSLLKLELANAEIRERKTPSPSNHVDIDRWRNATPNPKTDKTEVAEFAQQIAESINVGDPSVLDRSFDYVRLFERATVGLGDVTGEMERALQLSFNEGSLGSLLCRAQGANGSFRLLRVVRKDGAFRPLFRIIDDNQGVNYYELALAKDDAGAMRAIDIYYHTVGMWQSENLRMTVAALVSSRATAGLSPLRVEEIALLRNGDRMARMEKLFEEGRAEEALAALLALPKLLQRRPTLLGSRLKYAQVLGGRQYDEAVEAVETQVTDTGVRAFMLLDVYGGMGRMEEAVEQLRHIDRSIGGDPYLWVVQGNLRHQAGEVDAARDCYRQAAEKEPESPYAYYALLGLSLEEGDHAETARLLTALEQEIGLEVSDLSQLPDYRDFIASDEYRQWDESRSAAEPESP